MGGRQFNNKKRRRRRSLKNLVVATANTTTYVKIPLVEADVLSLGTVGDCLSESEESEHSWCEVLAQLEVAAL